MSKDEDLSHILDSNCEHRLGFLIMSLDGAIKSSGGELKDKIDVAKKIFAALRDSRDLLGTDEKNFQRMCFRYKTFQYAVQLSPDATEIAVVKDKVF